MALRESEDRFRLLVEALQDYALLLLDPAGCVLTWNEGARRLLGYEAPEVFGRSVSRFHPEEDRQRGRPEEALRAARAQSRFETEGWRVRRDGSRFWGNEILTAIRREGSGDLDGFALILRDLTERKRAEEALEEARKDLLRRLESAQEEERQRISRDLHDQAGQSLTAFQLGLAALSSAATSPDESSRILAQLQRTADELAQQLHTLALDLRPIALDDVGLPGALQSYVEEWAERSGVAADFHGSGWAGVARLPNDLETLIYRVVQEALTNVARHARARQVSVLLERRAEHVSAIVEDDGVGFDADALLGAPLAAGTQRRLGLLGMQERAFLVGGEVRIESSPGEGATVFLRLPLVTG